MKKSQIGEVIEFRLQKYLVYGVCIEENERSGDSVVMYARRFTNPIHGVEDLWRESVRCKIRFFVKFARSRKNVDLFAVVGRMDFVHLPKMDMRFRLSMAGISERPCWQIIDGNNRIVVPYLTKETALLSEGGLPNNEFIRHTYDNDLFPWSAELLKRGPLDFDPDQFEAQMRAKLAPTSTNLLH